MSAALPHVLSLLRKKVLYKQAGLHYNIACFGPIAQLGERTVRIRKVVGSIPIRSTISRKITAKSAVIFRLTTIIPQTGILFDHYVRTQAVSFAAHRL